MDDFDWENATHCECGQPLATHDPLPKPKPLMSWHAQRNIDERLSQDARNNLDREGRTEWLKRNRS